MTSTGPTRRSAHFAAELVAASIPAEVRERAALHLLDTLGCAVAAAGVGAAAYVTAWAAAAPAGRCRVVGGRREVDAGSAAFANAALSHALDFDDTHGPSICHISAVVCAAALAVADDVDAPGEDVIAAIVAGNEVAARIGMAAAPAYMKTGFHHTGVCGAFGATIAAARLRGLDAARTTQALGLCQSLASGSFAYLEDGSTAKIANAGNAARAGVLAAELAALGGDGPITALEGRFGTLASYFRMGPAGLEEAIADLGERWETLRFACKPYPACHFVHAPIDAAGACAVALDVLGRPDAIEAVEVEIAAPGLPLVAEPTADKRRPRTAYDAKFSVQYSVAAKLVDTTVTLATYDEDAYTRPEVLALADRVSVRAAELPTYPAAFPGRVTLTARGRRHTAELTHQRGDAANPLTADDILRKFEANASLALDVPASAAVRDVVLELGAASSARALTRLIVAPGSTA